MLSDDSVRTAGVLFLTVVAVQFGGLFVLRLVRGTEPATVFQLRFSRAGHAHAGVLVVLSLIAQIYVDASGLSGTLATVARSGIPLSAILMPAGFFFSATGAGREQPNRWIVLVYVGAIVLAAGVVSLGLGLLLGD